MPPPSAVKVLGYVNGTFDVLSGIETSGYLVMSLTESCTVMLRAGRAPLDTGSRQQPSIGGPDSGYAHTS